MTKAMVAAMRGRHRIERIDAGKPGPQLAHIHHGDGAIRDSDGECAHLCEPRLPG